MASCSECGKDYPAGTRTCPVHGEPLDETTNDAMSPTLAPLALAGSLGSGFALGATAASTGAATPATAVRAFDALEGGDALLAIGNVVGDYRLERVLGKGGMGTVYAATHVVIGKRAAVMVMAHELCQTVVERS